MHMQNYAEKQTENWWGLGLRRGQKAGKEAGSDKWWLIEVVDTMGSQCFI